MDKPFYGHWNDSGYYDFITMSDDDIQQNALVSSSLCVA